MKKEKVEFFEKVNIENCITAQQLFDKENKKFKFKLVCAAVSLLTTIGYLLMDYISNIPVISDIFGILMIFGWIATILSSPISIIKVVWNLTKFGWYIVPFAFIDLFGALVGLVAALFMFAYAPVVYCIFGLYQSYKNRKEAESYLVLNNAMNGEG